MRNAPNRYHDVERVEYWFFAAVVRLHFPGIDNNLTFNVADVAQTSRRYIAPAVDHPENYDFYEDSQGYLVITPKEITHA